MQEYHSIQTTDLIFYEDKDESWFGFPYEPTRGIVGCFGADRSAEWDIFVVIDFNKQTDKIKAIMPRIRFINGIIELGQDKLTEDYKHNIECKCPPFRQGDDFDCGCGAVDSIRNDYKLSFLKQDNTNYSVVEFEHFNNTQCKTGKYPGFELLFMMKNMKNMINNLERPTQKFFEIIANIRLRDEECKKITEEKRKTMKENKKKETEKKITLDISNDKE